MMGSLFSFPNFSSSFLNSPDQGCLPCAMLLYHTNIQLFYSDMGRGMQWGVGFNVYPNHTSDEIVRNQPCKVVYKKNLMQWNNVAFSFLWLFTGLCQLALLFCAEKRRNSLGVGDGGFSAWCPHCVLWFLVLCET